MAYLHQACGGVFDYADDLFLEMLLVNMPQNPQEPGPAQMAAPSQAYPQPQQGQGQSPASGGDHYQNVMQALNAPPGLSNQGSHGSGAPQEAQLQDWRTQTSAVQMLESQLTDWERSLDQAELADRVGGVTIGTSKEPEATMSALQKGGVKAYPALTLLDVDKGSDPVTGKETREVKPTVCGQELFDHTVETLVQIMDSVQSDDRASEVTISGDPSQHASCGSFTQESLLCQPGPGVGRTPNVFKEPSLSSSSAPGHCGGSPHRSAASGAEGYEVVGDKLKSCMPSDGSGPSLLRRPEELGDARMSGGQHPLSHSLQRESRVQTSQMGGPFSNTWGILGSSPAGGHTQRIASADPVDNASHGADAFKTTKVMLMTSQLCWR